jgi:hypothetical protein
VERRGTHIAVGDVVERDTVLAVARDDGTVATGRPWNLGLPCVASRRRRWGSGRDRQAARGGGQCAELRLHDETGAAGTAHLDRDRGRAGSSAVDVSVSTRLALQHGVIIQGSSERKRRFGGRRRAPGIVSRKGVARSCRGLSGAGHRAKAQGARHREREHRPPRTQGAVVHTCVRAPGGYIAPSCDGAVCTHCVATGPS